MKLTNGSKLLDSEKKVFFLLFINKIQLLLKNVEKFIALFMDVYCIHKVYYIFTTHLSTTAVFNEAIKYNNNNMYKS